MFWFFFYLKNFFINIFYFNNFISFHFILFSFILFLCFFLFFLPFILSHVDESLLVLQSGVSAVPLKWESQLQDTGPQENWQLYIISNRQNLPEISISTPRPTFTQWPAIYSAGHRMPNNEKDRNTATSIIREDALNHIKATDNQQNTTRRGAAHQKDKIQPHPPEHRHTSLPPRSLHNPLNKLSHWGQTPKTTLTTNMQPVKRRPQAQ